MGYHSRDSSLVRQTANHFNVCSGTVSKLFAKFWMFGSVKNVPKSKRLTVTTPEQGNKIRRFVSSKNSVTGSWIKFCESQMPAT